MKNEIMERMNEKRNLLHSFALFFSHRSTFCNFVDHRFKFSVLFHEALFLKEIRL